MKRRQLFFSVYAAILLYFLLFGRSAENYALFSAEYWQMLPERMNLVPFRTVGILLNAARVYWQQYQSAYYIRFAIINLGGNVLLFLPLGIFLPMLWQKQRKFWRFLLTVVGMVCAVEVLQLVLALGSLDVDDLLLNTIGAMLGFAVWKICHRTAPKP